VTKSSEIRIGIIGLGFMGRTHLAAYRSVISAGAKARIAAVADPNLERALTAGGGNLGSGTDAGSLARSIGDAERFSSAAALLESGTIDLVSICTPTDTHVDLGIAAVNAGVHVLLEKPVATSSTEVARLLKVAEASPKVLVMPAMCMRFWPGWPWLKDRIEEANDGRGDFGRFVGVTLQRLGSGPTWSREFYSDPARTGGAITDLHIHDVDFALWCFGPPRMVTSVGTIDHCSTLYRYANGPHHVVAQGGWNHAAGFPFTMRFVAVFEDATVVFDLSNDRSPLWLYRGGEGVPVPLPATSGYEAEAAHIVEAVARLAKGETPHLRATLRDSLLVAKLLEAERASQLSGEGQLF